MAGGNGVTMRFVVNSTHAAEDNSDMAKLRESTRMAMIAHGILRLGHSVVFSGVSRALEKSDRWKYFSHIPVDKKASGITIVSSRRHSMRPSDVIVKTSVGTAHDTMLTSMSKVLVAHEASFEAQKTALNVPFFVHDEVVECMVREQMFDLYINDDIDAIRELFDYEKARDVGFIGSTWPSRVEFFKDAPEWVDWSLHRSPPPMDGLNHAKWICQCKAAVALPGDTPKTNLPPLLAVLGIPMVSPRPELNTPQMDGNSMILFEDWNQLKSVIRSDESLKRISDNATEIYLDGWSPTGVARQIVRRISE